MSRLTDPLLGHQIGSYLLQDLLGEGGMARVYLGRHHEHGSYAAIKVIEADRFSDAADAERFRREGRNMFRLRHLNIVKFLEFGVVEDLYFLVVEYIDGADLGWVLRQYRLRSKRIPLEDCIAVAQRIGGALDFIHGKGTVHRDVKPSNIMITRDGQALLTDFGLALSAWESTHGAAFGSALYVSPEQAAFSGNAVPRSDIYSFGAVLYEMLTGSPPFEAETLIAIVLKHINESPAAPSSLNPALDEALGDVVMKALAKDPQDRYATAGEFVQSLIEARQAAAERVSGAAEDENASALGRQAAAERVSEAVDGEKASALGRQAAAEKVSDVAGGADAGAASRQAAAEKVSDVAGGADAGGASRKGAAAGPRSDQSGYGLPIREVVEARPPLVAKGSGMPYLTGTERRLPGPLRRWGVLAAAVVTGTLCAAVAVAGARGSELWSRLQPGSGPTELVIGSVAEAPSDRTPPREREGDAPGATEAGSPLRQLSCSGHPFVTRLQPGMYAYATRPAPLYDAPRTEHNEAVGQFIRVLLELGPGDRMLVLDHETYPNCYQEAYFLKVRTDAGVEGWVHEWRWHYYLRP